MNKEINDKKLKQGKKTLGKSSDSIDLARKFPLKHKGFVKPAKADWFDSIRNSNLMENTKELIPIATDKDQQTTQDLTPV